MRIGTCPRCGGPRFSGEPHADDCDDIDHGPDDAVETLHTREPLNYRAWGCKACDVTLTGPIPGTCDGKVVDGRVEPCGKPYGWFTV